MSRINDVEDIVYRALIGKHDDLHNPEEIAEALDAAGHLVPDLPAVVVRDGAGVRACREALEGETT